MFNNLICCSHNYFPFLNRCFWVYYFTKHRFHAGVNNSLCPPPRGRKYMRTHLVNFYTSEDLNFSDLTTFKKSMKFGIIKYHISVIALYQ